MLTVLKEVVSLSPPFFMILNLFDSLLLNEQSLIRRLKLYLFQVQPMVLVIAKQLAQ